MKTKMTYDLISVSKFELNDLTGQGRKDERAEKLFSSPAAKLVVWVFLKWDFNF